jgi:hypothetical protein
MTSLLDDDDLERIDDGEAMMKMMMKGDWSNVDNDGEWQ